MIHDIDRVVKPQDAANILGISKATLWRLLEEDVSFPDRVQITERCFGWKYSELLGYIDSKKTSVSVF